MVRGMQSERACRLRPAHVLASGPGVSKTAAKRTALRVRVHVTAISSGTF